MARNTDNRLIRERIAYLAARLMADDGVEDYGFAKRKAARQVGDEAGHYLPDNEEIDAQLRIYRECYQKQEHPEELRSLRELALEVMDDLADFSPCLTGAVLTGSAGRYADISLQVFADSEKNVEYYLLEHDIKFRCSEMRLYVGKQALDVSLLTINHRGVDVHLTVLEPMAARWRFRTSAGGQFIERAKRDEVAALIVSDQ